MKDSSYAAILRDHLADFFQGNTAVLAAYPGVTEIDDGFELIAFGQRCRLSPHGIFFDEQPEWGPRGIIVALMARHAVPETAIESPWRAFRELPNSAPYVGAFRAHTEQILVPHVPALYERQPDTIQRFKGRSTDSDGPADWSVILEPLPKIALCYHFYLPDEDFHANVTCLFSNNAGCFLPTDALADVGEYTSRALIASLD